MTPPNHTPTLAPEGLYRWREFKTLLPIGREAWRLRVKARTAPQPIHVTPACTAWRGRDLLQWLDDPVGYHVPEEHAVN